MINAKAKLIASDIKGGNREEHFITSNDYFEIPPLVYHEVHAITDITFLEFGFLDEDCESDTIRGKI